jgi:hypothetical protein
MNTGWCGFDTLIYFHVNLYRFLKNGALDGAQWSTNNISISPNTSRKKIMNMKTINLDCKSKRLVVFFLHGKKRNLKLIS